jgi:hypothetical protein
MMLGKPTRRTWASPPPQATQISLGRLAADFDAWLYRGRLRAVAAAGPDALAD